jgi:hypothetical protein
LLQDRDWCLSGITLMSMTAQLVPEQESRKEQRGKREGKTKTRWNRRRRRKKIVGRWLMPAASKGSAALALWNYRQTCESSQDWKKAKTIGTLQQ